VAKAEVVDELITSPPPVANDVPPQHNNDIQTAVALYDYVPSDDNELGFNKGNHFLTCYLTL
jgi:hypothetical protein